MSSPEEGQNPCMPARRAGRSPTRRERAVSGADGEWSPWDGRFPIHGEDGAAADDWSPGPPDPTPYSLVITRAHTGVGLWGGRVSPTLCLSGQLCPLGMPTSTSPVGVLGLDGPPGSTQGRLGQNRFTAEPAAGAGTDGLGPLSRFLGARARRRRLRPHLVAIVQEASDGGLVSPEGQCARGQKHAKGGGTGGGEQGG